MSKLLELVGAFNHVRTDLESAYSVGVWYDGETLKACDTSNYVEVFASPADCGISFEKQGYFDSKGQPIESKVKQMPAIPEVVVLGELSAGEVQSLFDVARMAGNFQDKSFRNLSCVRVGDHIVRLKPVLAFANILTELCPDGDGVEAYWFKVNSAINAIRLTGMFSGASAVIAESTIPANSKEYPYLFTFEGLAEKIEEEMELLAMF